MMLTPAWFKRTKNCSKECSYKYRSFITKGEKNPNWVGGISRLPYTYNWLAISRKIRKRDGNKCLNPECTNKDLKKGKIEAHHIDHDKQNVKPTNLITLCTVCNTKANFKRDKWEKIYTGILKEKYPKLFKYKIVA